MVDAEGYSDIFLFYDYQQIYLRQRDLGAEPVHYLILRGLIFRGLIFGKESVLVSRGAYKGLIFELGLHPGYCGIFRIIICKAKTKFQINKDKQINFNLFHFLLPFNCSLFFSKRQRIGCLIAKLILK